MALTVHHCVQALHDIITATSVLAVWTVTITSQPNCSVIHTLSHRESTVCSKPELLQARKGSSSAHLMGFGQGGEKTKQVHQYQATDWGTTSNPLPALPMIVKNKGHIVKYPALKVYVISNSKRSVVGMAFNTHFKGGSHHQESPGLSPQDKDPMVNQQWWPAYMVTKISGDLACDEEYIGETIQDLW